MNAEMVRATLRDVNPKTQTRRVVNQKIIGIPCSGSAIDNIPTTDLWTDDHNIFTCPYGKPGDRLWVREAAIIAPANWRPNEHIGTTFDNDGNHRVVQYLATHPDRDAANGYGFTRATPSIHMPRWASRITLEIINIRIERLNDISEEDAIAEGVEKSQWPYSCEPYRNYLHPRMSPGHNCSIARASFMTLWQSINGMDSWKLNPWVWAIEFKRI